ncbi:MAG: hypothetical protein DHS20C15_20060 [Planctomycetota bacterium]|nr:MAG: hypothetical protein DHS20C15_20060 [Planctomycetota bacterium]
MRHLLTAALLLGIATLSLSQDGTSDAAAADERPSVSQLHWLQGHWIGSDGESRWESVYSGSTGGQIVSATKELRGERVVMIDFEHFYERDGELRLTPFPFGNRSVEFTLTELDRDGSRAVFENPEHDFPRRFEYQRSGAEELRIRLTGEQGGQALDIQLVLERAPAN